jgi:hypothetical protein
MVHRRVRGEGDGLERWIEVYPLWKYAVDFLR